VDISCEQHRICDEAPEFRDKRELDVLKPGYLVCVPKLVRKSYLSGMDGERRGTTADNNGCAFWMRVSAA
jgi:hypothetical protein